MEQARQELTKLDGEWRYGVTCEDIGEGWYRRTHYRLNIVTLLYTHILSEIVLRLLSFYQI